MDIAGFLGVAPSAWVVYLTVVAAVLGAGLPVAAAVIAAEPVLLVAAMLAAQGRLSLLVLMVLCTGAAILSDVISYGIGHRYGRKALAMTVMRRRRARLQRVHALVRRRGTVAIVLQRWIPPTRGWVPAMMGATRMPLGRFVVASAAAGAVWAAANVLVVYFVDPDLLLFFPLVVVVVTVVMLLRRRRGRRNAVSSPNLTVIRGGGRQMFTGPNTPAA